jgi:hypothetical protein
MQCSDLVHNIPNGTDIILVGKIGGDCNTDRSKHWLAQINEFKKREPRVGINFTDNHFKDGMVDV